jgi:hypothetical protein
VRKKVAWEIKGKMSTFMETKTTRAIKQITYTNGFRQEMVLGKQQNKGVVEIAYVRRMRVSSRTHLIGGNVTGHNADQQRIEIDRNLPLVQRILEKRLRAEKAKKTQRRDDIPVAGFFIEGGGRWKRNTVAAERERG